MTRLIDADVLKDEFPKDSDWEYPVNTNEYVCEMIDAQPTVDAVPVRHGKWIKVEEWTGDVYYDCSACGNSWTTIYGTPWDNGMEFCPHCGARMDEE